jgi:hypothetical protein
MAHAVAIAYDWLHDVLGPDRAVLRAALYDKALKPALESYVTEKGWSRLPHNWNQVCNGGIVLAALAIADEEPRLAEFIIGHALQSVRLGLANYAPDGGWNEAAHFWHYATRYTVYMIAGLQSALGTDFGLSEVPGFSRTGEFALHVHGPSGRPFNYADTNDGTELFHEMFWLARRFDRPLWAWQRRHQPEGAAHALDLLWFDPLGADPKSAGQPLDAVFHGAGLAVFRSAWQDPDAVFVGLRAGSNGSSHNNLDLGDFVLEAQGKRWAVELGRDDLALPGYFGTERTSYYRVRTEGQNTLTVDGQNQPKGAVAPFVAFQSQPQRAFAIADLAPAYPRARSVRRGVALLDRERVLVQDEIESDRPLDVAWGMHTPARIDVGGRSATLTLDGATLRAQILSPADARFEAVTPVVAPPQKPIGGVRKLVVHLAKVRRARLVVLLDPSASPRPAPPVEPLARWAGDARPEHALRYRGEQPDRGRGSPAFPRDALVAAHRGR